MSELRELRCSVLDLALLGLSFERRLDGVDDGDLCSMGIGGDSRLVLENWDKVTGFFGVTLALCCKRRWC